MIRYKVNIMRELKKEGWNSTKIRKENLLSQSTITKLNNNLPVNLTTIDRICNILNKQPGDLVEVIFSKNTKKSVD